MRNQGSCIRRQAMHDARWLLCGAILANLILGALPAAAQEIITTVAGNGRYGFSGDEGQAVDASLSFEGGIAVDSRGNLYIADTGTHHIRMVTPDGTITTIAGNGINGFSGDGGLATDAALSYPSGLAMDSGDNLFILDRGNQRIRKVAPDGTISTIAGIGVAGYVGDRGPATQAKFNFGSSAGNCAIDKAGNLYIPDSNNNRIRKVDPQGIITTLTATPSPYSVAVNAAGDVYFGNSSGIVTRITAQGGAEVVAGGGAGWAPDSFPALGALLLKPAGVAVDSTGNIYLTDSRLQSLRKVSPYGTMIPVAGSPLNEIVGGSFSGDGGPPQDSKLSSPLGVAVGPDNSIYIADSGSFRIRKIYSLSLSPDIWTRTSSNLPDSFISALAVDPFDPETLYAGMSSQGVFKSANAGADWVQTSLDDADVEVLAVDPVHPKTVYAGTHDNGLLKSVDGGASWSSAGPPIQAVHFVAIDPRDSNSLLLAGYNNPDWSTTLMFGSTDAGRSWTQIKSFRWAFSFEAAPLNFDILYMLCSTGDPQDDTSQSCLWKSTDGGKTWAFHILDNGMYHLVVDPTEPNTLFSIGDIPYKSTDGGNTWTPYNLPIDSIAADPLNSGTLYSISRGIVYRSTNRGGSWSSLTEGLADVPVVLAISRSNPGTVFAGTYAGGVFKDAAMLMLDRREYCVGDPWKLNIGNAPANASVRLVGVSNGVDWDWPDWGMTDEAGQDSASGMFVDGTEGSYLLSAEISGIQSNTVSLSVSDCRQWTPSNMNLTDGDIKALVFDPLNPQIVYAGTARQGVFKSTNAGAAWVQMGLSNVQVNVLAMDRNHPGILYAGTSGEGLQKSADGGDTWNSSGPDIPVVNLVAIDPRNPRSLLAGYSDHADFGILFRSTDEGSSWTQIAFPRQYIEFIAIDPQNLNNIYLLDYGYLGMEDVGHLCKTGDGGQDWSCNYLHDIGCVWDLVVDPTDSSLIYSGCGEYGALKSSDGGLTWAPFDLSIETIAANPVEPGILYAIAGGIVYRSADGGGSWDNLTEDLGYTAQTLAVSGTIPEVVLVGTSGGGVYRNTIRPLLILDRNEYCVGDSWQLRIADASATASIRLVGVSNGVAWDWPDWGMTDETGQYGADGTFASGTQGAYRLSVEISGIQSNTVSFSVSECNP